MSAAISKADDFKRRARNVFVYAPLTIATVGMIVGIGSTQFIAYQMGYDQILGPPLAGPVYLPWRFIQWWQSPLAAEYARPFLWLKVILMGLVILAMMVLSQGMKKKPQKHPTLRGSSRLAGIDELKAIQLLPPDGKPRYGIYLGAWKASRKELQYLILTMNYNVLTIGPPRSGKTMGILQPTILSYPYSMIIWDPKGEIYHSTAGWRAKEANNYVLRWAPADTENTVSWNPFSRVRAGTLYAYRDVANVVGKIANPDGKPATDHWEPTAANFLAGLAFYQLHTTGTATCSGMLAIIDASSNLSIILEKMAACPDIYAAQVGRGMLATQDRERATIVSTSRRLLLPFRDPIIAKNTDTSDFVIEDLVNADRPVTLYIEVRGEDEDTVRPLIRLFLNLAVGVFSSQPPKYENGKEIKPWKWPLRGAIDEFAGLKEMKPFELALSKLPGYDITWILAVQDYQQIRKEYGDKEGITGQCQVIASYAANNQETREWLSKQAGKKTEIVEEVSESTSSGKRTQSVSLRHEQRDVITPDEIGRLKSPKRDVQGRITEPGDVLILHTGQYPIIAQQSLAFLNEEFKRRSNIPAPPTMTIRGTV